MSFGADMLRARHSPAVSYPLKMSSYALGVWRCAALASVLVVIAWLCLGAGWGWALAWRFIAAVASLGMGLGLAWQAVRSLPQGVLHWDGQHWAWETPQRVVVYQGGAQVVLDGQSLLLVRLVQHDGGIQCFVLQRSWWPCMWADVRRAVYSSHYPPQSPSMGAPS